MQQANLPKTKSLKEKTAEMTFEESFRLITKPLNLHELDININLQNPLVIALFNQLQQTQKKRRQMADLLSQKFKDVETEILLLEKAQMELEEELNWNDINEPEFLLSRNEGSINHGNTKVVVVN